MVAAGDMLPGHAFDDGAAGHFVDGVLKTCVSSRPNAKGYFVEREGDSVRESPLNTTVLAWN
jgi:hypothetical protein